jgi:hypothetical protein
MNHCEVLKKQSALLIFANNISFISFNIYFKSYTFLPEDVTVVKSKISFNIICEITIIIIVFKLNVCTYFCISA